MKHIKRRQTRRQVRLPSMKVIREEATSFFQSAKATGKEMMKSLRRVARRMTCRRR